MRWGERERRRGREAHVRRRLLLPPSFFSVSLSPDYSFGRAPIHPPGAMEMEEEEARDGRGWETRRAMPVEVSPAVPHSPRCISMPMPTLSNLVNKSSYEQINRNPSLNVSTSPVRCSGVLMEGTRLGADEMSWIISG